MATYKAEQIARLLPTLWSESAKLGIEAPYAPAPDMPKSKANPAESGDHMAHCADMSRAWERANLTLLQRQVLLMRYGLGWTLAEVGDYFGHYDHKSAERTEERAIGNLRNFLNGKREDYLD